MTDDLGALMMTNTLPCRPTRDKPLMGLTLLAVEDSRFASEALRLLCRHSGIRLRRADCLAAAYRHLGVYRPGAVLVDMGLPDGSGIDLVRDLARARPRVPVLLATSGDVTLQGPAMAAGADGFLAKPVASLAAFQAAILEQLPDITSGPRSIPVEPLAPDPLALRDDFSRALAALEAPGGQASLDYVAQFLASLGQSAEDLVLRDAARTISRDRALGRGAGRETLHLAGMLRERLNRYTAI
ncbi:response regulator [Plastorhodobacter daqingensis]|uniref:Response regulator n=1 Tax=Plastorhodobacter daqingensis TaxID=1387281 RepID=A0ABW2UHS8_9RHOB